MPFPRTAFPRGVLLLGAAALLVNNAFAAAANIPNPPQVPAAEIPSLPLISPEIAEAAMVSHAVPEGFTLSVYATPPVVNSTTAIAAAPDGTLYVGIDGNSAQGQWEDLGRILRLRDTDGDGAADEVRVFVDDIDSVRGLVWDHDHLIVMHAPYISAYYDRNGDGVAEDSRVLISGVGRPVAEIRVDHGQNGLEAGIDGWIYLALGDEGMRATDADGRYVERHGGAVVRFRPDGTQLELWAIGTRNIYGVAVGPLLDAFARDNTNDGGGWDVRMHYFSGLTDHGYPQRFINFPDEIIQPIADFGGGSGTGAAWIDEPGIPAEWNNQPYTADWGRTGVYRQTPTPNGATFDVTNDVFITANQPIDLDVDANSTIYLASWNGGGFNWAGPTGSGLVMQVKPDGYVAPPLPDFDTVSVAELVRLHESTSHRRRLEAQRAILRRGAAAAAEAVPLLEALAADDSKELSHRVAALFTWKQLQGAAANPGIGRLIGDPSIAAWALRALGDDTEATSGIPYELVTASLRSSDPRVRKEALITLARAGATQYAPAMTPLLADDDAVVAHTAMQALRRLNAVDAVLAVVDSPNATPALRTGALMVLQDLREPSVVAALDSRLEREANVDRRAGLVSTLARLAYREADWNGDWWSTRPDTTGPYFAPADWEETGSIESALNDVLAQAGPEETVALGLEFQRMGVSAGAAVAKFISYANDVPELVPLITSYFSTAPTIPAEAVPVLINAAGDGAADSEVRAEAVRALAKTDNAQAWETVLPTVQALGTTIGGGRGGGGRGGFGGRGGNAAAAAPGTALSSAQTIVTGALIEDPNADRLNAVTAARTALTQASFSAPANPATIQSRVEELAAAELALALGRADGLAALQSSVARLTGPQLATYAQSQANPPQNFGFGGGGRGGQAAGNPLAQRTRAAVLESPNLTNHYGLFVQRAAQLDGAVSQAADEFLLGMASRQIGDPGPAQAAAQALDAGWANPGRRIQIMLAAVAAGDASRAAQFSAARNDSDPAVASVARYALAQLQIDPAQLQARAAEPKVGEMSVSAVLDAVVATRGSVTRGSQLINELSCVACHTVNADDPPKGPFLGTIAGILQRRQLAQAILEPNNSISQGFATNLIQLRDGTQLTGFVVRESGSALTLRNIAAQEQQVALNQIANRQQLETSLMPAGLVSSLTITEFASLLDYLESLDAQ